MTKPDKEQLETPAPRQGSVLSARHQTEHRWRNLSMALLCFTGLLAGAAFLLPQLGSGTAFLILAHVVTAVPATLFGFYYIYLHFRRTAGVRRAGAIFTGLGSGGFFVVLAGTGAILSIYGAAETRGGLGAIHEILGLLAILILAGHVIISRKGPGAVSPYRKYLPVTIGSVATIAVLIGAGAIVEATDARKFPVDPIVTPYEMSYGEHPFRPSHTETVHDGFIDQDHIAVSKNCASCHGEIYDQWRDSMHAFAASDPTYVKNISLLAENVAVAAGRYCEGCHAPAALLSGQLTEGGKHGGTAGTPAFDDGVGCIACHGMTEIIHVKGVASYRMGVDDGAPFPSTNPVSRFVSNASIHTRSDDHKEAVMRPMLKTAEFCATCHEQFMDRDMNGWGWMKMQATYSEWLNSHYSGQQDNSFATTEQVRCQDCHMQMVKADDPSANEEGYVRSHRFIGANTAVAHVLGLDEQKRLVEDFLRAGKMRISIDEIEREDAPEEATFVSRDLRGGTDAPALAYLGETVNLTVSVANIGVGHGFPGGTKDINQAWVSIHVHDATGQLIYESGQLNEAGEVSPDSHFYHSIKIDREGKEVWKHDLFRVVGETYNRSVPPGEVDVVNYAFEVPHWAKGPLTIVASLNYRKLNRKYSRWALSGDPDLPITIVARDVQSVDVEVRPKVLAKAR